MYKKFEMELAGRTLRVDVDRVAKQANGAVLMHYGDTTVLCTATASDLSIDLLFWKILLFSQTKFLDQSTVSLDIYFLEVCKKSSSLSNHLKKSSS